MARGLPPDIEILMTEDGVYIEIEGFINFLRNNSQVPDEYKGEIIHLEKIADYLESQLQDAILQKQLLNGEFDTDKPN